MNPEEREVLYNYVLEHKPQTIAEVGSSRGGGSTFFIASAIANADYSAEFHAMEFYRPNWDYCQELYNTKLSYLRPYVVFHFVNSLKYWPELNHNIVTLDMLLLDGGIDSLAMVYDFVYGQTKMPIGSMLFAHDWDNGKSTMIKKILHGNDDWEFQNQMIGLVWYKRVKDMRGLTQ